MGPHPGARFDSATAMVSALSGCLRGKDFPLLGVLPRFAEPAAVPLARALNLLPEPARRWIYMSAGALEATRPDDLGDIDPERVYAWAASRYAARRYPAVAIGSSNGALIHLCAALGVPWLPQTVLIPVARPMDPDDPRAELEWSRRPAERFLARNPGLSLHHMFDPCQDRLMTRVMAYFRVKRVRLGRDYREFLRQRVEPGGTVLVFDCGLRWPTTRVSERHVFQFGGVGGVTREELFSGGPRVAEFLAREGSRLRAWEPPAPDGDGPESEWGFEPELLAEIEEAATELGLRVERLSFREPEECSPWVADLYCDWNAARGVERRLLVASSFIVMEPYWTLRKGCVPFWLVFNKRPSFEALRGYLKERGFERAYLMLFAHGVRSIGLVPVRRWLELFEDLAGGGDALGVDARRFPADLASSATYHRELLRKVPGLLPVPEPLPLETALRSWAESARPF